MAAPHRQFYELADATPGGNLQVLYYEAVSSSAVRITHDPQTKQDPALSGAGSFHIGRQNAPQTSRTWRISIAASPEQISVASSIGRTEPS